MVSVDALDAGTVNVGAGIGIGTDICTAVDGIAVNDVDVAARADVRFRLDFFDIFGSTVSSGRPVVIGLDVTRMKRRGPLLGPGSAERPAHLHAEGH